MYNQNKSYELTTTQLRKYEGFENITEDEAKDIIGQLKELSLIFYGIFQNQCERKSLLSNNRRNKRRNTIREQS